MPYYKWSGIDVSGNDRSGKRFAISPIELDRTLFYEGIALLRHAPATMLLARQPSKAQQILFFQQLAMLVRSGMHLPEALMVVIQQFQDAHYFTSVIADISQQLRNGMNIQEAFVRYPFLADAITLTLLQSGQDSGALGAALDCIVIRMKTVTLLKDSIKAQLTLPLITLAFFIMVVAFIFVVIIPAFVDVFHVQLQTLPFMTRLLIGTSAFMRSWSMLVLMVASGLCVALVNKLFTLTSVKRCKDAAALKIPFLGRMIFMRSQVVFLEACGLLIGQGVHLINAIAIAGQSVDNEQIKKSLSVLQEECGHGTSIGKAMAANGNLFSYQTRALINVGQETGDFSAVMGQAATISRELLLQSIRFAIAWIQPVMMLMLGLLVGALIFAIYVPLFNLAQTGY